MFFACCTTDIKRLIQVTKVELAEFLTKEGAYDLFDATEVTEVMQRFDKDGNGHLSPDEMLELRNVLQKRTRKALLRLLLSRFCLCLLSLSFLARWTSECKVPTRAQFLAALYDVDSLVTRCCRKGAD